MNRAPSTNYGSNNFAPNNYGSTHNFGSGNNYGSGNYDRDRVGKASSGGITTEEEKNHVIKVLEHESKVYKFEKNLVETLGMDERFDQRSEQGGYKSTRIRDF